MLDISNRQETTNQHYNAMPLHTQQEGYYKKERKKEEISVGENVEKLEPLCIAGGIHNGAAIVEKLAECGGFAKNCTIAI